MCQPGRPGPHGDTQLGVEVDRLIADREHARRQKNYAQADRIRDELKARGIVLEDTPQGVRWRRG